MKKLLLLIIGLITTISVFGQSVEGSWSGQLNVFGNKLRLIVNITKQDSLYTGTMDSPDQGAKGIPLSKVHLESSDLLFEIQPLEVSYKGILKSDTLIIGIFTQSGTSFPLSLVKGEIPINRPQEPKPPYPYNSEDVSFSSKSPDVVLAGTLTYPQQGSGEYPAVILVSGSGLQNRDEEIFEHKPFLVIADYLTRNGIAVLRHDDRGFGESTGNPESAATEDFLQDALGAFDYLLSRPEIDHNKIGIIGHSEGGTIAFMAAAQNPEVAFIVSLAGMAVRGDSLLVQQNRDIMIAQGIPANITEIYCNGLAKVLITIQNEPHEYILQNLEQINADIMTLEEAKLLPNVLQQNLITILTQPASEWMKHMLSLEPAQYILKAKCPVFAINGSKDLQVNANINLSAIENNLNSGGNRNYIIREYENLNHLFQNATTGLSSEYGQIEETIAPEILKDMIKFIFMEK